ncbi:MAG: molybdopterin cofactor-binding domain-containing protein [Aliishimia sp.]
MASIGKIARRTFLFGSVAIAGGVAFGVYAYQRAPENPLLADLGEGEAALTPYVKITGETITLITPRTDKGQGAYSLQAALIAEELDVSLDQVQLDPGPPEPAYYNTALAEEAAPFRSTDTSLPAESMRTVMDALMKFLGMHVTGGSSTVPDGYTKLRQAGANARETLKRAAAQDTGIDIEKLRTEAGAVILPDGTALPYTALAQTAAQITPPKDVPLRDPSEWKLLGKPMLRADMVSKCTGTLNYGIDFKLDGMLHATVKTNPANGGTMLGFDASEAEKMPGVRKIVEIPNGVVVVADNTWRAFNAAETIAFDWGPAPYPEEMDAHWETLSQSFDEDHLDSRQRDEGDWDAAAERAGGEVISADYRAPYLAHAPLEPISATVLVSDDRVDVWAGIQVPRFTRNNVAEITGMDAEDVHVHQQMIGGSFGHRLEDEVIKQAAHAALDLKGTPIKLTYRREEDMLHDFPRQIAMAKMQGVVENGKVTGLNLGIAMPSVIESQMGRQGLSLPGPDSQIVAGAWEQPYDIPDYRVSGYRAQPLAPISSWRSVGASSNSFFHDCALDELIHAAGADQMEERIRLMWHEDSRRTLETVAEMSSWGGQLAPNQARGVAFALSFGVPVAEVVQVTNTPDGIRIDKVWVATDVGRILDPVNFENLVQGGVIFGLGHAMNCEITYAGGVAEQDNYYAFEGMRMYQCPEIIVKGLEHGEKIRGIGEPPVPAAAPALANAIFAATGQRLREMPFNKFIDFV